MLKSADGSGQPSESKQPELSICVLHYQYQELTRDCIVSIDTQEIPCIYEKLLIDNGSDIPMDVPPDWRLFRSASNIGQIGGQNLCFEQARGDVVFFISNDVRLHQDCLKTLWLLARYFNGQTMPTILNSNGSIQAQCTSFVWPGYGMNLGSPCNNRLMHTTPAPDYIPSICYLMPKKLWKSIGGFDEQLLTSHEDVDMGLRLGRDKLQVVYVAKVTHLGNATLRHTLSHHRQAFHQARLKVILKHYRHLDYWTRYLAIQLLDHLPRLP